MLLQNARRGEGRRKQETEGRAGCSTRSGWPSASSRLQVRAARLPKWNGDIREWRRYQIDVEWYLETERTDKMQQTAEVALRALDSHLADGQWSTVIAPPAGLRAGDTFQFMDKSRGINATAVIPSHWEVGRPLIAC